LREHCRSLTGLVSGNGHDVHSRSVLTTAGTSAPAILDSKGGGPPVARDVAENNAGARQLYERRGMTVEATSPSILLLPNTRAQRMVKPL
jgi:hypothetical protein